MDFLDPLGFAVQNSRKELKFAQSARELILVGADNSGRVLEIIVVVTPELVLVIHAMDLRNKWRWLYDS